MASIARPEEFDQRRGSPERRKKRHASRAGSTYARFVRDIAETGGYLNEDAEMYAVAVVATLEERLPLRDVLGLESQLPRLLARTLEHEPILDIPTMSSAQLCARVALRLGITRVEAEAITRVVFSVLRAHISPGEATHIQENLSDDLKKLWDDEYEKRRSIERDGADRAPRDR